MISLIFISAYLIVSLKILGFTKSISDTHFEWTKKYKSIWSAGIFPLAMTIWSILVIIENQNSTLIMLAACLIFYVGACAAFRDDSIVKSKHYLAAIIGVALMLYEAWIWKKEAVIIWAGLSGLSLFSGYKIYIIEVLAIAAFYAYHFNT